MIIMHLRLSQLDIAIMQRLSARSISTTSCVACSNCGKDQRRVMLRFCEISEVAPENSPF